MAVPSEMKAWRVHAYGEEGNPADTISKMTLDTIPMPEPKPGQVLIKVELAAVNPIDWKLFSGGMHGICPVTFPYVPGFDVAGTVVKLGEGVGNVQVGDEVIADLGLVETCKTESPCGPAGAFAQYTVALASTVAKREGIPAKELVGLPLAGLTSYQALFTGAGGDFTGAPLGTLAPGQKLLVLGGAAATGAIAVQLGRAIGAEVATTASPNKMPDGTNKLDYMKKLGADDVINYKEADWSDVKAGANVDLIYDCVGTEEDWPKASKVLKKGGKFVTIANFGDAKSTEDHSFQAFLIKSDSEDLKKLVQFVKEGKLTVPVDCVVPFEDVPKVLTKSMGWASAGKLVIQVA
ncbi:unnamed protein product [Effrenium voratum]|uniref:Enoyl reductase (ER) domain-containing protein n=1 Tax=Effrenium voratum TaxID=2562239 RepID=A0AA36MG35_9DINO|nr:unnamed protein product [Effrenium voratum]CAJ1370559.1 unnamed protein product [Effrenium voratum]CAJ1431383.1 unnamed protein product [Effrenium voratum]|mmetsp:Transcript_93124/g.221514  ORF Transcript_93124/g.221514 Transcript_93124/m.221514 type:complete len:350 (+) Transcript_93124:56-1105(+)|eukprot:CAMPEP_0181430700 /NCGR_PEP_ID=MMETSP1110-20121109/17858_1 /TAXON_ID=174948 /ORGANISM="Symbiodinium sp., Strain CCMP421" /LENGTH=349 /DNA_ID=CAMNT_0023554023 /DNA_START=56 /DNA_END=1105 /DNA_ORIENTATION=-